MLNFETNWNYKTFIFDFKSIPRVPRGIKKTPGGPGAYFSGPRVLISFSHITRFPIYIIEILNFNTFPRNNYLMIFRNVQMLYQPVGGRRSNLPKRSGQPVGGRNIAQTHKFFLVLSRAPLARTSEPHAEPRTSTLKKTNKQTNEVAPCCS